MITKQDAWKAWRRDAEKDPDGRGSLKDERDAFEHSWQDRKRSRDDRPYFSTEPGVPFDEMQLAEIIASEGALDQLWAVHGHTTWPLVARAIDGYHERNMVRAASNILRRGWHYR